jgi:hypothetical protein
MAVQPLRPNLPFTMSSGMLTHDGYEFLFKLSQSLPQVASITTGIVTGGTQKTVTVPWTIPFSNVGYTAFPSITTNTTLAQPMVHVLSQTVNDVTIRITNNGNSFTGTLNVMGVMP